MALLEEEKKASLKACKKLSKSHTGKIPWNKGKKIGNMSEEQKRKISNTLKGKKVPDAAYIVPGTGAVIPLTTK
jgi:hypothetical protein